MKKAKKEDGPVFEEDIATKQKMKDDEAKAKALAAQIMASKAKKSKK